MKLKQNNRLKTMKQKSRFFGEINETDKSLASLTKIKRERISITNIRKETGYYYRFFSHYKEQILYSTLCS